MFTSFRSTFSAALALVAAAAMVTAPALARTSYVQDGASMFGASTVSSLNSTIGTFNQKTGKEVVVVTVPSLNGDTPQNVAEKSFASNQVNGVMIFLSKSEQKVGIIGDKASERFFPNGFDTIRQAMRPDFRAGNYDEGITTGVNLIIGQYAGHEGSLNSARHAYSTSASHSNMGGGFSMIWLIIILVVGFLIIRAIFRAISGPRVMPPGYGPGGGMGMGGPGYGGYGGGGFGGGGGGFFSGLLGGLGGAFLGNELFGRRDEGFGGGGYDQSNMGGGNDGGNAGDSAGWQSDPGQADMGNASFGDFGGGGGGGDSGGGGGW